MYSDCSDHTLTYSSVQYFTAIIQYSTVLQLYNGPRVRLPWVRPAEQCSAAPPGICAALGRSAPSVAASQARIHTYFYTAQLTHSNSRYNITTCEFNVSVYQQDQEKNQRNMNASIPNPNEHPPRNGKTVSLSLLLYTCFTRLELINYLPLKKNVFFPFTPPEQFTVEWTHSSRIC